LHALRSLDNPGLQSFPQLLENIGSTIAPGDLIDNPGKDKHHSIRPVILQIIGVSRGECVPQLLVNKCWLAALICSPYI
jgi:hypothetical protein